MVYNNIIYLTLLTPIVIFVISGIGNSIVIAILTRVQFRKIPLFRYLIVAAVFDFLNTAMSIVDFNTDFFQINIFCFNCKIFNYTAFFIYQCSPWIMVICSIDRLLAVKYPFKTQFRLKGKFQALAVYTILQFLALASIPFYIYSEIVEIDKSNTTTCGVTNYQDVFIVNIFNMLLSTIIPYIIIGTSTLVLGCHMMRHKKRFKHSKRGFSKERLLVKTLIAIDSFFLICYLPFSIYVLIHYISPSEFSNDFIYYVTNILTYIYSSSTIFILLASNHKFRNYFINLFCCRAKPKL